MLEKRFMESIEHVELHVDNFNAFSNGYALLIQAIGAELDTVFKEFCNFDTSSRRSIADYAHVVLSGHPSIVNREIVLQEYNIRIHPFRNWNTAQPGQSLLWWTAFTDIKHNRYDCLHQANQENTLNILGALYLIEMMYLKQITINTSELDIFDSSSNLFTLKNWTTKAVPLDQTFFALADMLSDNGDISERAERSFDA